MKYVFIKDKFYVHNVEIYHKLHPGDCYLFDSQNNYWFKREFNHKHTHALSTLPTNLHSWERCHPIQVPPIYLTQALLLS